VAKITGGSLDQSCSFIRGSPFVAKVKGGTIHRALLLEDHPSLLRSKVGLYICSVVNPLPHTAAFSRILPLPHRDAFSRV